MARQRVSQRLRARLKTLLNRGDQTSLANWSQRRPGGTNISQQELSYFLNEKEGRRGLTIDDLDDIADYLEMSIGELLGDTKQAELSAHETRMLHAFRALPEPYKQSVIAVIELASIAPKINPSLQLRATHAEGIRNLPDPIMSTPHVGARTNAPHLQSSAVFDPSAELEHVRAAIQGALLALEDALAAPQGGTAAAPAPTGKNPVPHRSVPSPRPK